MTPEARKALANKMVSATKRAIAHALDANVTPLAERIRKLEGDVETLKAEKRLREREAQ